MSIKSLSGEALAKLPKELEERAAKLLERETKLNAIEREIKAKAEEIDERLLELKKTLGIKNSHDSFLKLHTSVADMTSMWILETGDTEGLLEAIQNIISARALMISKKD